MKISCDETCIFQYNPEIKGQSMHWKTQALMKIKKSSKEQFQRQCMHIVCYDIKSKIIMGTLKLNDKSKILYRSSK